MLAQAVAEIEAHVHAAGWDAPPALFALVRAGRFAADDPETAARLGIDRQPDDALVPVEQDALPDRPLDEALAGIVWPAEVDGCALTQEIVVLPPDVEESGPTADAAARHPRRREARLVVGVLRDGSSEAVLRLRPAARERPRDDGTDVDANGTSDETTGDEVAVDGAAGDGAAGDEVAGDGAAGDGAAGDLLTGPDLAPNLVAALVATLG